MPGTSTMFKTFVIGVAGLYLVKTIADTEPPKTYSGHLPEKHAVAANGPMQMPALYDNDNAMQKMRGNYQQAGSEASQRAQSLFDDAQKSVLQAKKELESKKNERSGWNKFWANNNPEEIKLQERYDDAKKKLDTMKTHLSNYVHGQDTSTLQDVGDQVKDAYGKMRDYANDKYNDLKADSEEALRENVNFYKTEAEKAKKDWESTQSSWLHWRKAQSKEIQDQAQAKYNFFKAKNEDTIDQLVDTMAKAGKKTEDIVKEFGQQAQDHLNAAANYAKDAGNSAAKYVADAGEAATKKGYAVKDKLDQHAYNAKNYAVDAKDRAANVGYDAKEAVEDNAKYAKKQAVKAGQNVKESIDENAAYAANVAGDVKDRAVKAGADTAGKIQDDAEYVKNYLAEQKDNLLNAGYNAKEALKDNAEYVQDKVEDNAEYVKDKVQGNAAYIKNSVSQAGYNAKENVKENAEYAKNYVAGAKDKAAQYGYNAKENVKENADYAKQYVEGVKDRAAQVGYDAKDKAEDNVEYAKDQAEGYVKGAKNWIERAGENTKNMVADAYKGMWNHLGVFQAKSREVAEEAVHYYDQQVIEARKQYEETQGSWLRFRSAQPKDVQLEAKAQYELMKAKRDAAEMELRRWTDKSSR